MASSSSAQRDVARGPGAFPSTRRACVGDRELYTELWSRVLRDETESCDELDRGAWHVDLVGTGSEEHIRSYLRYYADDDDRKRWMREFPDYEMPAHEGHPYDRDARLPQPDYRI